MPVDLASYTVLLCREEKKGVTHCDFSGRRPGRNVVLDRSIRADARP